MDIYTVYKIICITNNKCYIGYTKNSIENRLKGHFRKAFSGKHNNIKFFKAIQKYGKNNFHIEPISTFNSKEEATSFEKLMIIKFNSYKKGYNSTLGGDGGATNIGVPLSDEHKKKISEANKGRIFTEEHKKNISKNHHDVSGVNNPSFGKPTKSSFKSGSEHPNSKSVTIDGITYESLSSASKILKMSRETIKKRYF